MSGMGFTMFPKTRFFSIHRKDVDGPHEAGHDDKVGFAGKGFLLRAFLLRCLAATEDRPRLRVQNLSTPDPLTAAAARV